MLFPFKITIHTEFCKYKDFIKEKSYCKARGEMYKVAFLWNFVFIWYLGNFELTARNHQGRNYYGRRHILTVAFLKVRQDKTWLKGINIVNFFEYLVWFLIPFIFAMIDGVLLSAIVISLFVMIFAMLLGFHTDKCLSEEMVKKLNNINN